MSPIDLKIAYLRGGGCGLARKLMVDVTLEKGNQRLEAGCPCLPGW